jgi:HAD superfamily hydrolase (TIGR01509 family)
MFKNSITDYTTNNKLQKLTPKAVFFDMDGVLFDSMAYHASAWVSAMTEIGIPFTIQEAYMNEGRTGQSTIDGSFKKHLQRSSTEEERETIYRLKSKYFEAFDPSPTIPFALEMLQKVKAAGLDIFLVTGSGQPSLLDSLQIHFPNIFVKDRMITGFDVVHGKPHPEPYLMALKKSKLKANEVVVIENAPLGVESATTAGLFTIAINTGPLDPEVLYKSGANIVLESMESLHKNWNLFINQCQ